ncbi:MAG: sigma-54 dependent transcriptional regulator [Brevinematales bacterium]|nr:sigma-54 dependent transcriptional regulator [Brevinematales bacterium]
MKGKILVVDDELNIRNTISDILKDEGYEIVIAESGEEAEKKFFYEDVDVIILDVMLPGKSGIEVLKTIHNEFPIIPIIIISGHGDIRMAVEAMKMGAFDFIEKPLSVERILTTVKNALRIKELQVENLNLKTKISDIRFIGKSRVVNEILSSIDKIASSDASVLITGENGTGKELIARIIHNKSNRKNYPFVGINCAAIPETLIESELFGYEKGAFTGAHKQKKGKIELAHRGTLFLDEVGDLSLPAQAKLLRVIQERQFERVGGNSLLEVDVRIISATNKDLFSEIKKGLFREDLYYRLNVIPVHIPPLRERKEDIEELTRFFVQEYNLRNNKTHIFSESAIKILKHMNWPGNVRELKNFVERVLILANKEEITEEDIKLYSSGKIEKTDNKYDNLTLKDARNLFEKQLIEERLKKFNYNISKTAESLDIDRSYLHKKLKEFNLD